MYPQCQLPTQPAGCATHFTDADAATVGGTKKTRRGGESREARGWLVRGTDIPQSLDHRTGLFTPSAHTQFSGLWKEPDQFYTDSRWPGL